MRRDFSPPDANTHISRLQGNYYYYYDDDDDENYARNVFMGINQRVLGVVRYSAGIVDWTMGDLELLGRKARKILTCNGLFHPRADVARLYFKRWRKRINIRQGLCSK